MHQPVQDGSGHGGIGQVFATILHHAVGGHDDAAHLATPMHDGLQHFGRVLGDAPGQEEIDEDQQVGLEQLGALRRTSDRVAGKLGVRPPDIVRCSPVACPDSLRPWPDGFCPCLACP